MSLRPYQIETQKAVKSNYEAGVRRQLVVAATGTGKTLAFANFPKFLGYTGQLWVLAHRDELIQQAREKIRRWNPDLKIGIEMAAQYADVDSDVVIASIATVGRKGSERLKRFDPDKVAVVACDEAHHSVAQTYINFFEWAGVLEPDTEKLLVGFTATPNRSDGEGLAKIYDKIVFSYPIRAAIDDGWLSDVRAIKLKTNTDLDGVRTRMGDFETDALADTVNTPARNQQIVKAWIENGFPRHTIVFCVDIQHSKDLALAFQKRGVPAAAIWGDDPDRAQKLADHKAGKLQVLTNCGVLTEGYDDWRIGCVVMAGPTKSATRFTQCIGRGTRLEEGIGNLKEALAAGREIQKKDCLVIDVVDSTSRHSLVTVPSLFGMSAKMDIKGHSVIAAAKKIEQAQQEHPDVDFTELEDIDGIQAHVESVNIWDVKFPEEVEQNSTLSWHRAMDGSFVLLLPDKEKVTIRQNMLDKWEVTAVIHGQKYKGERSTIEEVFAAADNLVSSKAPETKRILQREQEWHDEPMTDPQRRYLKRLLGSRPIPPTLTKGAASKLISQLIAGKMTGKEA